MRQVHTSSLNDVKTVFNSNSDNEQYYSRLKNSFAHKIGNVEFARPIVRPNNATIIWKAETDLDLRPFNDLSDDKQAEISFKLRAFFDAFKEKVTGFRNVSKDFAEKLIQIPNKNSLLVNEEHDYIVLVNWGYLEEAHDPKTDIIPKLFDKERSSILVKIVNKKELPIENVQLSLDSKSEREFSVSDEQGYARFGTLEIGDEFTVYEIENTEKTALATFVCDGRKTYQIEKNQQVNIKLIFKNQHGRLISNEDFVVFTNELGYQKIKSDEFGQYAFSLEVNKEDFEILDKENNEVFKHKIPHEKSTFEITIDVEDPIEETIPIPPLTLDNSKNVRFKFVNSFGRNIKNLNVNFKSSAKTINTDFTNSNGEIELNNIQESQLTYSFKRYNKQWEDNVQINDGDLHVVKVKPMFPWLWWIIIAILIFLLICCLFFNCFCKRIATDFPPNDPVTTDTIVDVVTIPCNTDNASGGAGITTNQHFLGNDEGVVYIRYDMMGVPDKMEIYYENKIVASTHDVPNNEAGYVGDDNYAGCCGTLQFRYKPNNHDYCTVVITGPNERTVWKYDISCPR